VITGGGQPIPGVQVTVDGGKTTATTDGDGKFRLEGLPSGTRKIVARKIGYAAVTTGVNLSSLAPTQLTLMLGAAQLVEAVHVVGALDDGLQKAGFTTRMATKRGKYVTPERIKELNPQVFTDLLDGVPGLKVTHTSTGNVVSTSRSGSLGTSNCVTTFVDNSKVYGEEAGDLDKAIAAQNIGAIEFYATEQDVPPQFSSPGSHCAALVVWTIMGLTAH
jgi:iron complex outermembrane receptor protein